MSIETIPQKRIIRCDGCGKSDQETNMDCSIVVNQSARDYQGAVVAGHSWQLDFCHECKESVINVINKTVENLKGKAANKD